MAKVFGLEWAFEPFEEHPGFFKRRMFGGLSAYIDDRIVMVLAESPGDREYRGKKYDFEIWNGVLFPTEREHHSQIQTDFPQLRNHPILPKWLYLPMDAVDFEETVQQISQRIAQGDLLFGAVPQRKSKSKSKKKKKR